MTLPVIVKGQAQAVDALAEILHVSRDAVSSMLCSPLNPLPLPPQHHNQEAFVLHTRYMARLWQWISDTQVGVQERADSEATEMDFATVKEELKSALNSSHAKSSWSVDGELSHTPPGYFLG